MWIYDILNLSENVDAVLIGPGSGIDDETSKLFNVLVTKIKKPIVLDADALKQVDISLIKNKDNIVLTPHFVKFSDIENFVEARDSRIFELRNMLKAERIPVKLYAGAELYLSDGVFNADNLDELIKYDRENSDFVIKSKGNSINKVK